MCGDLNKNMEGEAQEFWIHDVWACTENLLLAAHSMGLGAVWCAIQPNAERIRKARQILNIPDNLIPLCIVPVGYPAEQPAVKDKWKEENIYHNRFE
jgi:nitroreductase